MKKAEKFAKYPILVEIAESHSNILWNDEKIKFLKHRPK